MGTAYLGHGRVSHLTLLCSALLRTMAITTAFSQPYSGSLSLARLEWQQAAGRLISLLVRSPRRRIGSLLCSLQLLGPCLTVLPKLVQLVFREVLDANVFVLGGTGPD